MNYSPLFLSSFRLGIHNVTIRIIVVWEKRRTVFELKIYNCVKLTSFIADLLPSKKILTFHSWTSLAPKFVLKILKLRHFYTKVLHFMYPLNEWKIFGRGAGSLKTAINLEPHIWLIRLCPHIIFYRFLSSKWIFCSAIFSIVFTTITFNSHQRTKIQHPLVLSYGNKIELY